MCVRGGLRSNRDKGSPVVRTGVGGFIGISSTARCAPSPRTVALISSAPELFLQRWVIGEIDVCFRICQVAKPKLGSGAPGRPKVVVSISS